MRNRWVAAGTLLLTTPCAAYAQQPTLEQRVERMEAEVFFEQVCAHAHQSII